MASKIVYQDCECRPRRHAQECRCSRCLWIIAGITARGDDGESYLFSDEELLMLSG